MWYGVVWGSTERGVVMPNCPASLWCSALHPDNLQSPFTWDWREEAEVPYFGPGVLSHRQQEV